MPSVSKPHIMSLQSIFCFKNQKKMYFKNVSLRDVNKKPIPTSPSLVSIIPLGPAAPPRGPGARPQWDPHNPPHAGGCTAPAARPKCAVGRSTHGWELANPATEELQVIYLHFS